MSGPFCATGFMAPDSGTHAINHLPDTQRAGAE